MSTAAGDAPAPRTPTPSVKERTVALESELLRHTEATTSGGERNSVPSGTSQGGEKVGPDTPPGGAPSGSMTRADANGVDEAAASPVVVNVALMHDHRPDASRASLNGGKPRGAEAVDSEAVGYSDRDAAAAAATKPTDGDQRRPTSPTPTRVRDVPLRSRRIPGAGVDATDAPRRERRAVLPSRSLATTRPLAPYTPSRDTGGVFTRIRRVRRVDEPPGGDVRGHDRRHRLAARVHGRVAVRARRQRDLPPGPEL